MVKEIRDKKEGEEEDEDEEVTNEIWKEYKKSCDYVNITA